MNYAMWERVTRLREARGWSHQELAERAGIARSQVSRLEAGKLNATLRTLQAVASALSVDVPDLFERDVTASALLEHWPYLTDAEKASLTQIARGLRAGRDTDEKVWSTAKETT